MSARRRADLTGAQACALREASGGPLYRSRAGWSRHAGQGPFVATASVEALRRKGLLRAELAGCAGVARITAAGRRRLAEGGAT